MKIQKHKNQGKHTDNNICDRKFSYTDLKSRIQSVLLKEPIFLCQAHRFYIFLRAFTVLSTDHFEVRSIFYSKKLDQIRKRLKVFLSFLFLSTGILSGFLSDQKNKRVLINKSPPIVSWSSCSEVSLDLSLPRVKKIY